MNILILTGRFGMGHVKAAEAIRESVQAADPQIHVNIVDFTDYLFPHAADHIYQGFHFLVNRCSRVYNYCNRLADHYGRAPFQEALLGKIDRLLAFFQPDLIVATLPFCGQYISAYKKQRRCTIPLYTYITDVTLHEEWISDGTDLYFAASVQTQDVLLSRGIPPGKIIVSGVPVRQAFLTSSQRCSTHPRRHTHVLIMGGGLGMITCRDRLLQELHDAPHVLTTVIAGRNSCLARQLRETYPNFRVIGYTEEVHHYMREADLLITKPGGVTTFEAIAAGTPIFFLPPKLEQEKGNALFIVAAGIGLALPQQPLLSVISDEMLESMRRNMSKLGESFADSCPLSYFSEKSA